MKSAERDVSGLLFTAGGERAERAANPGGGGPWSGFARQGEGLATS
jgi:hypothetical protein